MLAWSNSYSVGVPRVDADHITLLSLLNQMHINLAADKNRHALAPVLQALLTYADNHFRFEETLMEQAGYPELDAHREKHESFRQRLNGVMSDGTSTDETARRLRALLSGWLFDHIMRVDARMGAWLREHPPAPGPDGSGGRERAES